MKILYSLQDGGKKRDVGKAEGGGSVQKGN